MKKIKKLTGLFAGLVLAVFFGLGTERAAFAETFSVSPMNEEVALTPGETYYGSLKVTNPASSTEDFVFMTEVSPFSSIDETDHVSLQSFKNYNLMTDWVTVLDGSGAIAPNETRVVHYKIEVPLDAPGGGQYASILVRPAKSESALGQGINIQQTVQIAYLIYASIAGETTHAGQVESVEVPGFLFSEKISGTATIKNESNVHEYARITLQVFPLFSSEEIFTNEEDPDGALVMPEATQVKTTTWNETPDVGVFKVKYAVEFEGETKTVEKLVIKCPIWLLFTIILAVVALIVWLATRSRLRKKSQR